MRFRRPLVGLFLVLVLVLVLAGALVAWVTSADDAPPPRYAVDAAPATPELSRIRLPVRIALSDLAETIESQVPDVLVNIEGEPVEGGWLADLFVMRPGEVVVEGDDEGRLLLEFPLDLEAVVRRERRTERRAEKGMDAPNGIEVTAALVVHAVLEMTVGEDWSLQSTTTLSHEWIERPKLEIGPLRIDVTRPVDRAIEQRWAEVADTIDARIAEQTPLREPITAAWDALSQPRQVDDSPPTWLVSRPISLALGDPVVRDGHLELEVGVVGRFGLVLGAPLGLEPVGPLPERAAPSGPTGMRLALPLTLPWDELSAIADERLAGQRIELAGAESLGSVTVESISLYPSGERFAVALGYSGSSAWETRGTLYLLGRPELDADRRTLRISSFETQIFTGDPAFSTTTLLVESGLEAWLRDRLEWSFGPQLDAALANAESAMTDPGTTPLQGSLDRIEIAAIHLAEEALIVDTTVIGELSLVGVHTAPGSGVTR